MKVTRAVVHLWAARWHEAGSSAGSEACWRGTAVCGAGPLDAPDGSTAMGGAKVKQTGILHFLSVVIVVVA